MTDATRRFSQIARRFHEGAPAGIPSVCSAHPIVIEAALRHGLDRGTDVLIEATCNQVNQDGGYTGMTPADFRRFVEGIATEVGFPLERLVLGGDHLGPNPWKALEPGEAMRKAEAMIAAFAAAGFTKLHLDASMGCRGEPAALPDAVVAERAARLAGAAERAVPAGAVRPSYVIGTEVPVPGGALEALDHLAVTRPGAVRETVAVHREAFRQAGLDDAFARAVAAVVQPGVEFGNAEVVRFRPAEAQALTDELRRMPQFVFEAHSTDYQDTAALRALVEGGFVILKVGPWLTFALREALYGLDAISRILDLRPADAPSLAETMERVMLRSPANWQSYYPGTASEQRIQRHYSFSDRIRYYWPEPQAEAAVDQLLTSLGDTPIPLPLVSQHLGHLYEAVEAGRVAPDARALLLASVQRVLDLYAAATGN